MNIYFDMGGVLETWNNRLYIKRLSKMLKAGEEETTKAFLEFLPSVDRNDISSKEFLRRMCEKVDGSCSYDDFKELGMSMIKKKPEMISFAKSLKEKGHFIGICSNAWDFAAEHFRRQHFEYVDHFLISCEVGVRKPDPEMYALMEEPDLFIDDFHENIEGAKKVGLDAIKFEGLKHLEEELKKRGLSY
ncbi:MAG: HAD family phosphatase [Nanoarchaeota archaeon]|nr:HAD family phosphatase [Nanoarchaeota archaeon]